MHYYRIVTSPGRVADLSGTGSWLVGGRWNPIGVHALYLSENPALSMLELLVHADSRDLPNVLWLATLEVDDAAPIRSVVEEDLPADWSMPDHLGLKRMGKEWLTDPSFIGFQAPSAVMPVQRNLILHPGHSAFQQYVRIIDQQAIRPDARLLV